MPSVEGIITRMVKPFLGYLTELAIHPLTAFALSLFLIAAFRLFVFREDLVSHRLCCLIRLEDMAA
ncbi:hypothetical protein AT251_19545 [Enterovibrio nigricans]|nr:hypothetical protein AT251_19545 [Enterovibrio nigricans]